MRTALWIVLALNVAGSLSAEEDWRQFRGPTGEGHSGANRLPLNWDENHKVVWKTAIHDHGWSSPVVCEKQIWMMSATGDGHRLFAACVDRETGKIVHDLHVFNVERPQPIAAENTYATPTPAIEPGRVYVHFGAYGAACLDTATAKPVWTRRDLPCRHFRGPGSSPLLYGNLLVLTFDGVDQQYVAALDKNTGETVWKTSRTTEWKDLQEDGQYVREGDFHKAFCTPIVIEWEGRPQLISPAACAAFAYDPLTGAEIWKTHHDGHSASPRPLFGHGLVYVVTGHRQTELWAIRPGGQGDVTGTHVAWRYSGKEVPKQPSPLLVDDLIYMVSNEGYAVCLEALTGALVWSARIGGNFMASPVYAGGRIYIPSMQGETTVMKTGRAFEILAENRLESGCLASPAVSGNALFLRTKTHLYRIETAR